MKQQIIGREGKAAPPTLSAGLLRLTGCALLAGMAGLIAFGLQVRRPGPLPGRTYRFTLPANQHWLDTGFDVRAGDVIDFLSEGAISLQLGNPVAFPCGPEGLDLPTIQQPLRESNIGALIGRILLVISVDVDEETGEETRTEMERFFEIGRGGRVEMPLDGQLFLGVNELVVEDNSGEFRVEMRRPERFASRTISSRAGSR